MMETRYDATDHYEMVVNLVADMIVDYLTTTTSEQQRQTDNTQVTEPHVHAPAA